MRWALLLAFMMPAFLSVNSAKQKKADKPKQEKMATLYKNARNALKNQSGQDAARDALLGALARPALKNRQKAKIYYHAALLEESLNGVENRKAFLKQKYDTAVFFNKLRDMYERLRLCDSVDLAPDAKGRVRPHMQRRTRSLRLKHRRNILGGGRFFLAKKDYASAYPFLDLYTTYSDEAAAASGQTVVDSVIPQAETWATLSAFMADNYGGTVRHADAAISYANPSTAAILHEYKVRSFAGLGNDSAWVASLRQGVETYPNHDYFFVQLADWYQGRRDFDAERRLADDLIARTGGKAIHYYAKSKSYLSEDRYDECVACADSAISLQADCADAFYNKGIAFLNKAVISQEMSCKDIKNPQYLADKERTQGFYQQARPCMEMVRKLQPERQDRWASPLYRIYLNLNLGDEFVEIDKLLNAKK